MRLTTLFGAALGTGFLFLAASSGAMAYDNWDHDHWRHERYEHERYEHYRHDRPVYVHERPVVVERERPVFVAPQPMYVAPVQQGPSGLNLNFNIPLQ
jgi:hypothetical protein